MLIVAIGSGVAMGKSIDKKIAGISRYAFGEGLLPDEPLDVDDYADKYRKLSEKSSPEPGQWKTSRVPFVREIMKALSTSSDVQDVSLMKGTQISGTETGNNFFCYVVDHSPGPMMIVQPTLDMAKRYSRQRLTPMIADMPSLSEKIADSKSRDGGNTLLEKNFMGGYLVITGANSSTGLRSMPVRYLFMDETDTYPFDLDNEGDPEQLAIKRTQNFSRKKILRVSTPTIDGMSRIQKAFKRGDQRYYHVPCPHCGGDQKLVWKNIKWNKALPRNEQPDSVFYECMHCHQPIQEHHKTAMLDAGRWIAENPDVSQYRRSYHISSLYSPLGWYSWREAVEDWLNAKNDVELLKTFTNTVLAEVWKESVNDVEAKMLQGKAEPYEMGIVPQGGLILFSGCDTQDDRLESYVYAFGRGEEAWLIDYEVFLGDPSIPETEPDSPWTEMKEWLIKPWLHASGAYLTVDCSLVDSGGHYTHDVYKFCRDNKHLGFIAGKGASQRNKPIINRPSKVDIDWRGRLIKRGLDLYQVGTDTAKSMIYSRFLRDKGGAGAIHYPDALPLEIFEQLTSEKLVRRYKKGFAIYEWVKNSAARNEALDCTVYMFAAAQKKGVHRWSNKRWDELEAKVQSVMGDLFAPRISAKKATQSNNFGESKGSW